MTSLKPDANSRLAADARENVAQLTWEILPVERLPLNALSSVSLYDLVEASNDWKS